MTREKNIDSEPHDLPSYVREIQRIGSVPQILDTVANLTGLRVVAVAHVSDELWTICAMRDGLELNLKVGDHLDVSATLCQQVRDSGKSIIIDHVEKSDIYRDNHVAIAFNFQSYFSIPIFRPDGAYFGTLCGQV